jgi:YVTN family beta-propeller protein
MGRRVLGWVITGAVLAACGATTPASRTPQRPRAYELSPGQVAAHASTFGTDVIGLPTGATLTPDAAPGARLYDLDPRLATAPAFRAGNAVATALSPDGRTLAVLTSGYNLTFDDAGKRAEPGSSEYVFFFDVSSGDPRQVDVATVPNAFGGLAFAPDGAALWVSGGSDDVVHVLTKNVAGGHWASNGTPIALGHAHGLGIGQGPYAGGLALTPSGARAVVANHENDTISILDTRTRAVVAEVRLPPGGGKAGGEFPAGIAVVGETRAFVACQRDRELVEVDLGAAKVVRRITVGGQPTKLVANRTGTRLYVANANSDTVSVVDVAAGKVVSTIGTAAVPSAPESARTLRGSNPNAVALSPDEKTLYVTNGGNSTLAVVRLDADRGEVIGLVPTGFYPNAVSVSARGERLFVAHGKSPTGPNPGGPWSDKPKGYRAIDPGLQNQYAPQLTHGGLLSFPVPAKETLERLTAQSLANNRMVRADEGARSSPGIFTALLGSVKHVIYVIGENRTYDQLLGDVTGADGDPKLVLWGEAITPNHHQLARTFTTYDRFFDSGGVSGDGWQWSVSGRSTDVAEKAIPVEYAGRGAHTYDWEGANRGINVGLPSLAQRTAWNPKTPSDPDLLPGTADVGAIDGPDVGGRGFLWDVALAAGRTVRNYGVFCEDYRYGLPGDDPARVPPIAMPWESKTRVAFPTARALTERTDPYFRGFDMTFADFWREKEWEREFDEFVAKGELPSLELVRLPHDHLGTFDGAEDGLSTPDHQIADHDYALGRLVEKVSRSPFWESTVIVMVEDDAQNGADHVDAHRSFVLFAGGHVKRGGAVVSTPYATPSVLRTIGLLLGLPPLGQQDAFARPFEDAFAVTVDARPVPAIVPAVLRSSRLPLPPLAPGETLDPKAARARGDAASWALATRGMDFRHEDTLPTELWNRQLACGLGVLAAGCASEAPPLLTRAGDDDD